MSHRSTPPESESVVEDFTFDDAPRTLGAANDNGQDGPAWVWVLIRQSGNQRVFVRFAAEAAPPGFYVKAANPPKDGDDGVVVLPRRCIPPAASSVGSSPALVPFLKHVSAVAAVRAEALRAIARGFDQNDIDAVIKYARALVGG